MLKRNTIYSILILLLLSSTCGFGQKGYVVFGSGAMCNMSGICKIQSTYNAAYTKAYFHMANNYDAAGTFTLLMRINIYELYNNDKVQYDKFKTGTYTFLNTSKPIPGAVLDNDEPDYYYDLDISGRTINFLPWPAVPMAGTEVVLNLGTFSYSDIETYFSEFPHFDHYGSHHFPIRPKWRNSRARYYHIYDKW